MGEEEKKPEEKKEEKKEEPKAEKPSEDKKKEDQKAEESKEAPPQEIVLRVYMHCEGCARKVRRCLKGFEGVEDVQTDCKMDKVVVKGDKADPLKVLDRVQKKSHRKVELLSPVPKPPAAAAAEEAKKPEEKEAPKPEEKKEEPITVILNVHMHCEACAQEIKRRILRMDGVENVEPDLKSSQVTVKGVFDPQKLVEYVRKRTGKHASIVKQESEKKEDGKGKEEKKADGGGGGDKDKGKEPAKEKKDGGEQAAAVEGEGDTATLVDLRKSEFYSSYPQNYQIYPYEQRFETYPPQIYPYEQRFETYPPQIFSDENPNACSVM